MPTVVQFVVSVVLDFPRSRVAARLGMSAPDANVDGLECGVSEVVIVLEFVEKYRHGLASLALRHLSASIVMQV